jgi:hypothetical protein
VRLANLSKSTFSLGNNRIILLPQSWAHYPKVQMFDFHQNKGSLIRWLQVSIPWAVIPLATHRYKCEIFTCRKKLQQLVNINRLQELRNCGGGQRRRSAPLQHVVYLRMRHECNPMQPPSPSFQTFPSYLSFITFLLFSLFLLISSSLLVLHSLFFVASFSFYCFPTALFDITAYTVFTEF